LSIFGRFILEDWGWDLEEESEGIFVGGGIGEIRYKLRSVLFDKINYTFANHKQ
jgi:hypothetical protein